MSIATRKPTGRFAPTPSGRMHLGNLYAAMIAYLSLRSKGGRFLLRIEDLDAARCPREGADELICDMTRLGFEFDGEILYQSERGEVYERYAQILEEKDLVYPCFCSRAELHAAEAPHLSDGSYVYGGKCRSLTKEEREEKQKTRPAALRVKVPDEEVTFDDMVKGRYSQNLARGCGDFIIRRSDGVFAYQLAVVVDDALSGVTEVVRGDDLISSAPRQIWLNKIFGFEPPAYAHIPLLTAADGRRLSKRDGDTVAEAFKTYAPEQIIGRLAHAAGIIDKPCPIRLNELIPLFDICKINKTPTI